MKNILCFGDSNTWGFMPAKATRYEKNIRWTGIAAAKLGQEYNFIEDCISGRTTVYEDPCVKCRCGSASIGYSLLAHAPLDMLIFALGTNDLKFTDSDGSLRGITRLIDMAFHADILFDAYAPVFREDAKFLLLGPPIINPRIKELRPAHALANAAPESILLAPKYKQVAKDKGIYYLSVADLACPGEEDCLHLSAESHSRIGNAVADKILEIFSGH